MAGRVAPGYVVSRRVGPVSGPPEVAGLRKPRSGIPGTDERQRATGQDLDVLRSLPDGSVDLVVTSPPYALVSKKAYGNVSAAEYVDWFRPFATEIHRVLRDTGSFALNLGGVWNKGLPTRSLYHFRVLVDLVDTVGLVVLAVEVNGSCHMRHRLVKCWESQVLRNCAG